LFNAKKTIPLFPDIQKTNLLKNRFFFFIPEIFMGNFIVFRFIIMTRQKTTDPANNDGLHRLLLYTVIIRKVMMSCHFGSNTLMSMLRKISMLSSSKSLWWANPIVF